VERRGRGESGDGASYALAREAEDVTAVVEALGAPANLLGHSFGALCALEAALGTAAVRRLVLYEPGWVMPGVPLYPAGALDRMEAQLAAGDREGLLTTLYREVAGLSSDDVAALKAAPAWPARVATAHTVLREARAEEAYVFDVKRLKTLETPTLLLTGEQSPPDLQAATEALAGALPNCRVRVLEGQGHTAMYTAPKVFGEAVRAFLEGEA